MITNQRENYIMFFLNNEYESIENTINRTALKQITIKGLFGRNNVTLCFDKTVNIFIGENGLGKTTILNCVYYVLHSEYEKLVSIPFDEIIIKFSHEHEKTINRADVMKYLGRLKSNKNFRYMEIFPFIEDILEQNNFNHSILYDEDFQEKVIMRLSKSLGISYGQARASIVSYLSSYNNNNKGSAKNIIDLREKVSKLIDERVIYLTTYRRIEKDYSEYFNPEKERYNRVDNDSLIRFGMKDVSKAINNILGIISDKTNQGFNKMTGILLSKYASISPNEKNRFRFIDYDLLKIVLDRLGQQINEEDKKNILELVSNEEIYKPDHKYLLDLIDELINNYNQLKIYDEKIMMFKDTCNRYLNDKQFIYNQSEISLKIISDISNDEIDISMLSSGEKQIVSLFSRLYLESDKKCILLIDEPELSISMRWQKMLLPDIIRSNNCNLLITVTHSPFIFENEFDNDAQDMWYCFDNIKRNEY